MPSLPKSLAAVRAAVASLLRPADHSGSLYSADDIADALNIAANVDGSASISTKVDVTLLLRAFANDAADEFVLAYDQVFGRQRDRNILYVRKPARTGCKGVTVFGRFSSMEVAKRADVVRWHVKMDDSFRDGLVRYLEEASRPRASKKKRRAGEISPDGAGENRGSCPSRQPLVAIQQPLVLMRQQPHPNIAGPPVMPVLHYILDGRAGKMTLPSNGLVLARKLRENLLPPDEKENDSPQKEYTSEAYGSAQYWAPAGVIGFAKHHLTRLQQRAKVADRWSALFDGKQCRFSNRFLRTLSMFGLHNMRGSDEGMELLIAGVVKGLAEEVGLPLTNHDLSYGCPSWRTLARGDKRLAADVLILVVRDIQRDDAKYIALFGPIEWPLLYNAAFQ